MDVIEKLAKQNCDAVVVKEDDIMSML